MWSQTGMFMINRGSSIFILLHLYCCSEQKLSTTLKNREDLAQHYQYNETNDILYAREFRVPPLGFYFEGSCSGKHGGHTGSSSVSAKVAGSTSISDWLDHNSFAAYLQHLQLHTGYHSKFILLLHNYVLT